MSAATPAPSAPDRGYVGRFAPSPTGPLHFGSLIAAVGGFLQARSQGGRWRVRIEDLDPPREAPGAAAAILRTLEHYGLHWDDEVLYQSQRRAAYEAALEQLRAGGAAYPCACTRKEIAAARTRAGDGPLSPGTCRAGLAAGRRARAWRVNTKGHRIVFTDRLFGRHEHDVARTGDFVIRRADGLFAYQLAVVVDDATQGVTEVVRGSDLFDSTPRQILLQRLLGLPTPAYLHLPVALTASGEKLSKQTGAAPLRGERPQTLLCAALRFLGQTPPPDLHGAPLDVFWTWAISHWNPNQIPPVFGARAVP